MTLRRRLVDWVLVGILILVPALVLRSSLSRGTPSAFDQAVVRITAPLEAGVSWIVEGIGGMWARYVALVDVESENRELREENDTLRKQVAELVRAADDVAALEELALVKKRTPTDTLGARVIGAPLSPQFRVMRLRIDRGDKEVQQDLAVIAGTGPVGRIDKVYGGYADVVLISDTRSKVDVVLKRTGARGTLVGLGKPDSYACVLKSLELAAKPELRAQVGDEIVTSGVGSIFPPGLVIGKVSRLDGDDGMFQNLEVEPTADVSRLRAVTVLLVLPPPADPDAKTKKRSEPAFMERAL
ncbi:MAG: rod shape-determining protein MreC [Deltaproteobacteria bacterium]|nr:rod shape-determining protein MreC [Deltaproteobacteria bacterium]MCW5805192.1 rod shape-determining protein MreC [Deltaproteobacteria bacterium]